MKFSISFSFAGYHQKCHSPGIPADALEYFTPWICSYCSKEENNPHIEKNPFEGNEEDKLEDNDIHIVSCLPFIDYVTFSCILPRKGTKGFLKDVNAQIIERLKCEW